MLVGPYRDLYPFLKPHIGRFILALVFGALFGLISGLLPLVLNYVNSQVFPNGKNKVDMLNAAVNGTGAGINSVVLVCSVIPFIFILRSLCDYLNSYYMAWVALRVLADIRCKLYSHILDQSLEFFNRERSGKFDFTGGERYSDGADSTDQHQQRPDQTAFDGHQRFCRADSSRLEIHNRQPLPVSGLHGADRLLRQEGSPPGKA